MAASLVAISFSTDNFIFLTLISIMTSAGSRWGGHVGGTVVDGIGTLALIAGLITEVMVLKWTMAAS